MTEAIEVEDCGENVGDYDIPIHNAIIIPRDATNGDMIKALFPNARDWEVTNHEMVNGHYLDVDNGTIKCFTVEWWNAPYKGGCNLSEKPTGSESEDKE